MHKNLSTTNMFCCLSEKLDGTEMSFPYCIFNWFWKISNLATKLRLLFLCNLSVTKCIIVSNTSRLAFQMIGWNQGTPKSVKFAFVCCLHFKNILHRGISYRYIKITWIIKSLTGKINSRFPACYTSFGISHYATIFPSMMTSYSINFQLKYLYIAPSCVC